MKEIRSRSREGSNGCSGRTWSRGRGTTDAWEGAVSGGARLWFLKTGIVRQKGTKVTETPKSGKEIKKMRREKTECSLGAQDTHCGE